MMGSTLFQGYVGSKSAYIAKYKALFDKTCKEYVEPFVGGGAVYFSNYNGEYEKECINDINTSIMYVYHCLANERTRDKMKESILSIEKPDNEDMARKQFREAKEFVNRYRYVKDNSFVNDIEYARNSFIVYSQSYNAAGRTYSKQKSNMQYKWEVRNNLNKVLERLVTKPIITADDGMEVIEKVKKRSNVQLFVDPPYLGVYRNSNNLYNYEMSDLFSHMRLAALLRDSKAAVVLCGYRSSQKDIPTLYDAMLTGEQWHCYKIADTLKKSEVIKKGEKKQSCTEYVWTNRTPEHAGLHVSLIDYKEKIDIDEYWNRIKAAVNKGKLSERDANEYRDIFLKFND